MRIQVARLKVQVCEKLITGVVDLRADEALLRIRSL